ncbi:hypothetical protein CC80DRAFT_492870 [Byssothecium circinans]|uniref:SGNH hydrolase-type esterase domain-containing protein n=1 Tax=Byssothecium circinans TaxID=147558 RepID=A0A6A5TWD0_9PLEO|nr:hypothetical protein CC80DRAFT_492870 [Byssothecium circinans]
MPSPSPTSLFEKHQRKLNASKFYSEYKGHTVADLTVFHRRTRELRPNAPVIWLAGDSSLDNKYWLPGPGPGGDSLPAPVPIIYEHILNPPLPKADVAFWVNHVMGENATCINTSIEESMLRERDDGSLLPQDAFLKENLEEQDVVVVSVGGNDIALKPTPRTVWHLLRLSWFTRRKAIEDGSATSLQYFKWLFQTKTEEYIANLVSVTKPRAVIVCMIYYPLEAQYKQKSWASAPLAALGYTWWPGQLQAAIRKMFEMGTKEVRVEGTEVIPCALFEVMDGRRREEYVARVEPSVEGGRKMALRFGEVLEGVLGDDGEKGVGVSSVR